MRQFVIGDVHGCKATLVALLEKINAQWDDEIYFLGDYIDRGRDSKGVLDTIFTLIEVGYKVTCLTGNHEAMLLGGYKGNRDDARDWLDNGGKQALKSFLMVNYRPQSKLAMLLRHELTGAIPCRLNPVY